MNRLSNYWKSELRAASRRGYAVPSSMIIVGLIIIIFTPFSDMGLEKFSGEVDEVYRSSYSKFTIIGTKEPFTVQNKKNKAILEKELPNAKYIEVWTKKISLKKVL